MRTIAQEIAFHLALRKCSKEVEWKVSIYAILEKGDYMQSSTYFFPEVFYYFCDALLITRNSHHHGGL